MSALHELVLACAHAGLALDADGERLTFEPANAMTSVLALRLREQKAELLAWMQRADEDESVGKPSRPCGACGCRHFTADVLSSAWQCARCTPPGVLRTDVEVWTAPGRRGGTP